MSQPEFPQDRFTRMLWRLNPSNTVHDTVALIGKFPLLNFLKFLLKGARVVSILQITAPAENA